MLGFLTMLLQIDGKIIAHCVAYVEVITDRASCNNFNCDVTKAKVLVVPVKELDRGGFG